MKKPCPWPKAITEWHRERQGFLSVPFTWLLPDAVARINQRDFFTDHWIIGGPAAYLMPDYILSRTQGNCLIGRDMTGVLQRINPQATRTTIGCPRRCDFCGVRLVEGRFQELPDWPDLPVLCDNNLLAASTSHFDRVIDRLVPHGWCDFNQGLDARLLTAYHASRIAEIHDPIVRLSLDSHADIDPWQTALDRLLDAGITKSRIRSYILCGFDTTPTEAHQRCQLVKDAGVLPCPMWFHPLNTLQFNPITQHHLDLGWTHRLRRELFCWFYQHRTLATRG